MASSIVGNHDLCGKQINVVCKDGSGGAITDFGSPTSAQNQVGKRKYSGKLLISASATVGALLLVALMCFWGCFYTRSPIKMRAELLPWMLVEVHLLLCFMETCHSLRKTSLRNWKL